jgi:hypothetical protein
MGFFLDLCGPAWITRDGWGTGSVCNWHGITCDSENGTIMCVFFGTSPTATRTRSESPVSQPCLHGLSAVPDSVRSALYRNVCVCVCE